MDILTRVAHHLDRAVEDPVKPLTHRRTKIGFERLNLVNKRCKDHAFVRLDAEFAQRVLRWMKVGWISAFSFNAATKRNADEIPLRVIRPLMVHALMAFAISARFTADNRAPVRTAIDKGVQDPVAV